MIAPYDVRSVRQLGDHRLPVGFADGTVRVIDLDGKLTGSVGPVFEFSQGFLLRPCDGCP